MFLIAAGFSQSVNIISSKTSPQAVYAEGELRKSLLKKKLAVKEANADFVINLTTDTANLQTKHIPL
jgi:hypothetical protein